MLQVPLSITMVVSTELFEYPSEGAAWYPLKGGSAAYHRRGEGFPTFGSGAGSLLATGSMYLVDVTVIVAVCCEHSNCSSLLHATDCEKTVFY